MKSPLWKPLFMLPVLVTAACTNTSGNTNVECRQLPGTDPNAVAAQRQASAFHGTVFTIVLENKSASQILSGSSAHYLQSLAHDYALARGYRDSLVHPSEPNYIWMVAGENFGILDDGPPAAHHIASTSHLADQIEQAGLTWKSYQESMGEPCTIVSNYPYEPKHDPFVYFDDVVGWDGQNLMRQDRCRQHVVDYAQFGKDLAAGALPDYVFITPDMKHDMHDGSIADGDAWLSREVPRILASPAYQNGGVLFITWDEGSGKSVTDWSQDDDPPMIVVSPLVKKGYSSNTFYDTSSYLKTVQRILGLESLPCDPAPDEVNTMDELFTVPLPASPSAPGPAPNAADTAAQAAAM